MADLGSSLDAIAKRFGGGTFADIIDRAKVKGARRKQDEALFQSGITQQEERNRADTAFNLSERIRRAGPATEQERLQEDLARTQREVLFTRDKPDLITEGRSPTGQRVFTGRGQGTSLAEEDIRSQSVIGKRLREAGLKDVESQTRQRDTTTGILSKGAKGARDLQQETIEQMKVITELLRGGGIGNNAALSQFLGVSPEVIDTLNFNK